MAKANQDPSENGNLASLAFLWARICAAAVSARSITTVAVHYPRAGPLDALRDRLRVRGRAGARGCDRLLAWGFHFPSRHGVSHPRIPFLDFAQLSLLNSVCHRRSFCESKVTWNAW